MDSSRRAAFPEAVQRGIELSKPSVYGMQRIAEDFSNRPELDDLARIHHGYFIGDLSNDSQIVRDHQ